MLGSPGKPGYSCFELIRNVGPGTVVAPVRGEGRAMERTPERELMDDPAQAEAYAGADFEAVNSAFVEGFRQRFPDLPASSFIADLGCGPGDIALRLAQAFPGAMIQAVDGAEAMIGHAERALAEGEEASRVVLVQSTLQDLEPPPFPFNAVVSNSLLHQLQDGGDLWRTLQRTCASGTAIHIQDLKRPESEEQAGELVAQYASEEPEQLRTDFYNSLLAAFTPEEVRAQLETAELDGLEIEEPSDRHLLIVGQL